MWLLYLHQGGSVYCPFFLVRFKIRSGDFCPFARIMVSGFLHPCGRAEGGKMYGRKILQCIERMPFFDGIKNGVKLLFDGFLILIPAQNDGVFAKNTEAVNAGKNKGRLFLRRKGNFVILYRKTTDGFAAIENRNQNAASGRGAGAAAVSCTGRLSSTALSIRRSSDTSSFFARRISFSASGYPPSVSLG